MTGPRPHRRQPPADGNPWGLTAREVAAMDAMVEHGCIKLASTALGVGHKTVEAHLSRAGAKIAQRTTLLKYLAWDRWRRDHPRTAALTATDSAEGA